MEKSNYERRFMQDNIKTPCFYDLYALEAKKQEEEEEREWEEMDDCLKEHYEQEAEAEEENAREREKNMTIGEKKARTARRKRLKKLMITEESAREFEHTRTDYCKEDTFQEMVLDKIFPGEEWVHDKAVPGAPRRTRPDFRCERLKIIVEYNGHRHYTQASTILADVEKKKMYENMGYMVVEWPYWVQPDKYTVPALFHTSGRIFEQHFCDFHQGFVSKKCILPADFCSLGEERFYYELSCLPTYTILQVLWSLENKKKLYGEERVWPSRGLEYDDYYIDGTRHWLRKVHTFGFEESMEIGQKVY